MSKGAKTSRSWGTVGLQAAQTLAHVRDGGGVQTLLRRGITRPMPTSTASSAALLLATLPPVSATDGHADTTTPTAVALDIPVTGLWGYSWEASFTPSTGLSGWIEGGPYGASVLATADAGGSINGGGLLADQAEGDSIPFSLVVGGGAGVTTLPNLTVRAFLIRRGAA